ncbi:MAG: hypothetical protein EU542_06465 [Promethearchaeota archaeon]|nr:MAG: hypothetical protein EU542_06465 [Candidatus Lokiarchaeota archaeon]
MPVTKDDHDYMKDYMATVEGTPDPIVQGVLLFFKNQFTNERLDSLRTEISNQQETGYSLENTEKILDKYELDDETSRQIIALLNKKFKEAIEKKELTSKKLAFIRSIKKKH